MFHPPFCPYKECSNHAHPPPQGRWWSPWGSHGTKAFGRVPRFRCSVCGRTFSTQTFSLDYYAKRVLPYARLERLAASSMSIRALGRELECSRGSVINRLDRLSRQAIALHASLRPSAARGECVCFDGLVSFDRSQYFPNDIGISISSRSRFILGISHATTRRSGATRPSQKKRRDELYKGLQFERRAIERSFSEHLDMLKAERVLTRACPLVLITDEKIEYRRALEKHPLYLEQDEERRVAHWLVPSTLPRTRDNPLFASNYCDREVRKDQAQHRRQTACFSRSAANGMTRMYSYMVWHNYGKRYLIDWPVDRKSSHAEVAGVEGERIRKARRKMFEERAFLTLQNLLPIDRKVWTKTVYDLVEGREKAGYLPQYAMA